MPMTPDDLRLVSNLLDKGSALPVTEREAWLGSLAGDAARLAPMVRELMAKQAAQETADLIDPGRLAQLGGGAREGQSIGPYVLVRELGHGGMSAVWLAERADASPRRKVALKLPYLGWAPGLAERFARESQILAGLEHPHIARLYDAGVDEQGRPYMALEYVEGETLDAYSRNRSLPVKERLELLLQVAAAVAFAHGRLVVHRDLKPGNILVTPEGEVRLLDFGIAKLLEGTQAAETELTRAAGRALTLDYASPEQILGRPIGTASDVYSLGVVAYELLSGARPYHLKRGSPAELEEAITTLEPPLASDAAAHPALRRELSGDLDAILNKALKKNPVERYATADALAQDWRRYLGHEPVLARPDSMRYRLGRFARRHRVPLAAGAVVAASLLAATGVSLWQAQRASEERDRAFRLVSRNEAVTQFLNMVLTQAARGRQGLTAEQLMARSEALVEQEFPNDPEHRATVLALLGTNLQTLGQPQQALRLLERSIEAVRGSKDTDLVDQVTGQHAFVLGWVGRSEEGKATLKAIAERPTASAQRRAEAHHYLASIAARQGEAKADALHHANEALRWHGLSPRPSPRLEVSLLASLGYAHGMNGRVVEGERFYETALAKLEVMGQSHSPHAIALTNNWAVMNLTTGDAKRALELSDRNLATAARDAPDSPKSPFVLAVRARALEDLGRYGEAVAGWLEAAETAGKLGNVGVVRRALLGRAQVYALQHRPAEAATLLDEEARLGKPGEPPDPGALVVMSRLALERNEPAKVVSLLESGRRKPEPASVAALLLLSEAYLRLQVPAEALRAGEEALAMADGLRGGKPVSFRSALAQLAVAKAQRAKGDSAAAGRTGAQALEQLRASVDAAHPALAEAEALVRETASR